MNTIKMKIITQLIPVFLLISFSINNGFAQCFPEAHTPFYEDAWISCTPGTNPNSERPVSHWIMYDLGWEYVLDEMHVWNYNVWGITDQGMRQVAIDYSIDGTNWNTLGTFTFPEASGSVKYEGFQGPSFDNTPARYVLLTAISNWGNGPCVGLGEVRIDIGQMIDVKNAPSLNTGINVFPNPATDNAWVSVRGQTMPERVALYNVEGKLIQAKEDLNSMNVNFNIEDLPSGVYLLKAWVGGNILSEKISKI